MWGENKEIWFRMCEESRRMAKKYPWWKLIWWKITDSKQYGKAVKAKIYGEIE